MSRWPPDTAARLKGAALALFSEHGFANVTAAQVAERAGMTERTFFRHFKTKDDVLFEDYHGFKAALTEAIALAPMDIGTRGLMRLVAQFLSERFQPDREMHRTLLRVVISDPTLKARALLRDDEWGDAVAEGFTRRGYAAMRGLVVAAVTTAIFRIIYRAWLSDQQDDTLAERYAAIEEDFVMSLDEV